MADGSGEKRLCSVEGCGAVLYAKGLCRSHLRKQHLYGDPLYKRPTMGTCGAQGCDKPATTKGYCNAHYKAARRHDGDPLGHRVQKFCTVPGCGKPMTSKGLCNAHYKRQALYGSPYYVPPPRPKVEKQKPERPPREPAKRVPAVPMLSPEAVAYIQTHRDAPVAKLAKKFRTTIRTVIAVRAGRTWGFLTD